MADSNEAILDKLKNGTAKFAIVSIPSWNEGFFKDNFRLLFGWWPRPRLSPVRRHAQSLAMPRHEHYFSVVKVEEGARSLFHALVKGMDCNDGISRGAHWEKEEADELRRAVKDVLCGKKEVAKSYEDAVKAIRVNETVTSYCERTVGPDFWGGEAELMVLSKLSEQPIMVYRLVNEDRASRARGKKPAFILIAEYGSDFKKDSSKKVVRLLFYSGKRHYNLLC